MTQFDVYCNHGRGREHYPYFMVLQHDLFDALSTRLVVPLAHRGGLVPVKGIHLCLSIEGKECLVLMDLMTSVDRQRLARTPVGSAQSLRTEIIAALDLLVTGI
ncbi:CcdB family protein [Enterobacteriaceae bacterium BIT-l23]|uniref:Toxin CcdB n=1 Tax=Jejubacter calystegiae TaxID=2579935 RepID=A0A4P8YN26_9ENTR|nr:CcdB family protein [Jejubacter calystegiae]NUU66480.1 CcdB family protein [Enterobacteriaceae bacterium BIT-l23]QCT21496.1 plasmid maintenance protein CcdB [Jejubacter calystegiae]